MSAPLRLIGRHETPFSLGQVVPTPIAAPPTRDQILALLPPCYTPELDDCVAEVDASAAAGAASFTPRTAECAAWFRVMGYPEATPAWKSAMEALPYCPEPKETGFPVVPVVASLLGGFVLGAVLL